MLVTAGHPLGHASPSSRLSDTIGVYREISGIG